MSDGWVNFSDYLGANQEETSARADMAQQQADAKASQAEMARQQLLRGAEHDVAAGGNPSQGLASYSDYRRAMQLNQDAQNSYANLAQGMTGPGLGSALDRTSMQMQEQPYAQQQLQQLGGAMGGADNAFAAFMKTNADERMKAQQQTQKNNDYLKKQQSDAASKAYGDNENGAATAQAQGMSAQDIINRYGYAAYSDAQAGRYGSGSTNSPYPRGTGYNGGND